MAIVYDFQAHEVPRLLNDTGLLPPPLPKRGPDEQPRMDLTPIKLLDLRLCVSKEWYRFPGHYLVPDGIRVDFVKSDFSGLLPGHFGEREAEAKPIQSGVDLWPWPNTRLVPTKQNDLNREEPSHYVPIEECDYLLDLDFPQHPSFSSHEPRYALDATIWDRLTCQPFLDASHSRLLTRILWLPGATWQKPNEFGDYCLLRNRRSVARKEDAVKRLRKV